MINNKYLVYLALCISILLLLGCGDDTTQPPPAHTTAEIHAFADEHFSIDRLAAAFGSDANDFVGTFYYNAVNDHEDLSLWVSQEDDEREFYENLGKWNQFVFGWDDFIDPRDLLGSPSATSQDLSLPEVSAHRVIYREMQEK
jgi:hypothetical protein